MICIVKKLYCSKSVRFKKQIHTVRNHKPLPFLLPGFIAADRHDADRYWVVRDSDSRLFHEVYADQGTGEEGELELLEPNAFADIEEDEDAQTNSNPNTSSDDDDVDSSGDESEESDDLAQVQPSLAAEIARDRDRWIDDMYD